MSALDELRSEIMQVSKTLATLLHERHDLVKRILALKQTQRMPLEDVEQEDRLVADVLKCVPGELPGSSLSVILKHVIAESKRACGVSEAHETLLVGSGRGPRYECRVRNHDMPRIIAGPCAIESQVQLESIASTLKDVGLSWLRAGIWKPRTHPASFQGMGQKALELLKDVKERYDLVTVCEIVDPRDFDLVAGVVDVVQIGARNMYNYSLLSEAGMFRRPVLLKRAFGATVREWILAAEYIARAGNDRIIFCERGIRTFETATRNTLDLSSIPIVMKETRMPAIVDVSHGLGRRDLIPDLVLAALAVGAAAVMIEIHPHPDEALSDGPQQLSLQDFRALPGVLRQRMESRLLGPLYGAGEGTPS